MHEKHWWKYMVKEDLLKMNNELIYHLDKPNNEMLKTFDWIQDRAKVLEFGCHSGVLSSELKKKDCKITGVEINSNAMELARPNLENAIVGNINEMEVWNQLGTQQFEVITWMHVLEHLLNPLDSLKLSVRHLSEDGVVIIALPNISNARERFDFLFGRFDYTETGVMDKTHLKFYNYITAKELIREAGLEIIDYYSGWITNPTRQFLRHLPIFHHLTKYMAENKRPFFPRYSNNITDVTMMFKCRVKK